MIVTALVTALVGATIGATVAWWLHPDKQIVEREIRVHVPYDQHTPRIGDMRVTVYATDLGDGAWVWVVEEYGHRPVTRELAWWPLWLREAPLGSTVDSLAPRWSGTAKSERAAIKAGHRRIMRHNVERHRAEADGATRDATASTYPFPDAK